MQRTTFVEGNIRFKEEEKNKNIEEFFFTVVK